MAWGDAWTPVATVNLAQMNANAVKTFTDLKADFADSAKFFRVRAALSDHLFGYGDQAPVIAPEMLVANCGAVIDLSTSTLPLNLSSFDTDATDPGIVYVKAPAGAKAGDVLMTAPAVAAKSMAALAPQDLAEGLKFVVAEAADGRLALTVASDDAPDRPVVEGDPEADVAGDAASGFTVTPSGTKKVVEVTIPDGVAAEKVTVEVGPDVERITPHGANVKIVKGGHDITGCLDIPAKDANGAIDLTKATVKEEIVKEALDPAKGAEISIGPASVSLQTANTRPGLTYTLKEGTTLLDMKAGATTVGDGQPWTPTVTVKGGTSGFYTITVEK